MVAELTKYVSNGSYLPENKWKKYNIFDKFMAAEVSCEMFSKVRHNGYVDEVEKELKGAFTCTVNIFLCSEGLYIDR